MGLKCCAGLLVLGLALCETSTCVLAYEAFQYAGCYNHSSQALIHEWDASGLTWNECREMAVSRNLAWFVNEFPQGYRAPGLASCGFKGDFRADGRIDDRHCRSEAEPRNLGGRGCFAIYMRVDQIVNLKLEIDGEDRVLFYLRQENITRAALRFQQQYGLSSSHIPILSDSMKLRAERIEYARLLGSEELRSAQIVALSANVPADSSVVSAAELGGEAKMYLVLDGGGTPRFIFKDRSEFWAVQHRVMWGRHVSLTSILRPIIREAYLDDLMSQLGFPSVYEPAWPAALCLDPRGEPPSQTQTQCHGARGGGAPRCQRKILGLLQRYVPVTYHSPSGDGDDPHRSEETTREEGGEGVADAVEGTRTGSIRAMLRSGLLAPTAEHAGRGGDLLRSIRRPSFDALAVFWFVSGHPDLHGGNVLLQASGDVSCIDADMALEGAPGCMMGPLQMPCIFSAIDGFSAPCPFSRWSRAEHAAMSPLHSQHSTHPDHHSHMITDSNQNNNATGVEHSRKRQQLLQRHDACPQFPQADVPFLEATARRIRAWDVEGLDAAFFSNASLVLDACRAVRMRVEWCPRISDIFAPHVYAMFRMRAQILQQIVDSTTPIRELYSKFLRLYLHRILSANMSSYFPIDHFKLRDQ